VRSQFLGRNSQGAAGIVLTAGFAAGYFLATWFKPRAHGSDEPPGSEHFARPQRTMSAIGG